METRKLLFLLVVVSSLLELGLARPSVARRHRRSAKPPPGRVPTVYGLMFQCCNHGWIECCNTTYLTNSDSFLNQHVRTCIATAHNELPTIEINVVDQSRDKREVEEGGEGGEGEDDAVQGQEGQSQQTTTCYLSKAEKDLARDRYCRYLGLIDILMHLQIMSELIRTAPCVWYDPNPNFVHPEEILEWINTWHFWMTSKIHCCHFLGNMVPWTPPSQHNQQKLQLNVSEATSLWSRQLAKVMDMMHMFDLMMGLGRRRTCLRGCVNIDEVDCCNLLPYEIRE